MTSNEDDTNNQFTSLYLGYASNLSPRTMKQRCPDSIYVGLGRLEDFKWIINTTGYANIIPSPGDVVYGGLYFLSGRDEAALDLSEGVPWMYEKHKLAMTRFGQGLKEADAQKIEAVAYVDVQRVLEGTIEEDYVFWVNRAIDDGLECGIPASYVEKYLKPVTPANKKEILDMMMIRTRSQEPISRNAQRPMPVNDHVPGKE